MLNLYVSADGWIASQNLNELEFDYVDNVDHLDTGVCLMAAQPLNSRYLIDNGKVGQSPIVKLAHLGSPFFIVKMAL